MHRKWNSETGSTFKSARNSRKCREIKYFPKKFAKKVVEVKPEVVVYFGLLLILTQVGVVESEKRVAAIFLLPVWALAPFDARFCRILAPRKIEQQGKAFTLDTRLLDHNHNSIGRVDCQTAPPVHVCNTRPRRWTDHATASCL